MFGSAKKTIQESFSPMEKLTRLRQEMKAANIDAYIIPSVDAHGSEYPSSHHQRRVYISGFTGSAGTAVVTNEEALLWTDGRYFLQAEEELDSSCWKLMKGGLPNTPSVISWLRDNSTKLKRVSADAFTLAVPTWKALAPAEVVPGGSGQYVPTPGKNLVDLVWNSKDVAKTAHQPPMPANPIEVHPMALAGESVTSKLKRMREKLSDACLKNELFDGTYCLVLTDTSDSAWLFNLRGTDFEYNPMFFSYTLLTPTSTELFCHVDKLSAEAKAQLEEHNVSLRDYGSILSGLKSIFVSQPKIKFFVDTTVCVALYETIAMTCSQRVRLQTNFVEIAKAKKNESEIKAAKEAHIADAKALCTFLMWLEKSAESNSLDGEDEFTLSERLDQLRFSQPTNRGLSFPAISSVDANGAVIHYRPKPGSAKKITKGVYLIDSGGQYTGGTTDVTRTIHLGDPTDFEKECWTRVLQGHINLCQAVFPYETKGPHLDVLARQPLWSAGLDYLHGTGHGVGAQLSVHEGPIGITSHLSGAASDVPLEEGMILSNEPGFYLPERFGIRHENLVTVVPVTPVTRNSAPKPSEDNPSPPRKWFSFENLTLVPFQKKFMLKTILSPEQIEWINAYHAQIRKTLVPRLDKENDEKLLQWLHTSTEPISA